MTEFEKMRSSQLHFVNDEEIQASKHHAGELCAKLQLVNRFDDNAIRPIIRELIPGIPDSAMVYPPFFCNHGSEISIGKGATIGSNCFFFDGAKITIGSRTIVDSNCQLITIIRPTDWMLRRESHATCLPISIGNDSWIGAGVIILPGVKIGNHCIIAPGSVVERDIPDNSMAIGNPIKVSHI